MMEAPPDAPLSVRLGAKLGPEVVASILVVAVVIVGIAVALSGRQSAAAVASQQPSSPAASNPVAVATPGASIASVPPASPVASPSPVPPSATPIVSSAAGPVLEIVARLLDHRAGLEAELDSSSTDAPAIAELLRDVNASIVSMDSPLIDLAADSSTADLATRIRAVNTAVSDAVRRTQRASIRNETAYREGAVEVVSKLEPMIELRAELAALAGESASP